MFTECSLIVPYHHASTVLPLPTILYFYDFVMQTGGKLQFAPPPASWRPWDEVQMAVGDLPVFAQLLGTNSKTLNPINPQPLNPKSFTLENTKSPKTTLIHEFCCWCAGDGKTPYKGPAALIGLDVLSQRRVILEAAAVSGKQSRRRRLFVS
jgi:hypothetical protein